jgi:diaminopimelate decarboxylase
LGLIFQEVSGVVFCVINYSFQNLDISCFISDISCFLMLNSLGSCGVRFNPGLGSGGTEKTNVGGPSASFGIWHTEKENVQALAAKYNITIKRIHTHIGSGSDPSVWINAASMSLSLVDFFSTVTILNLGESV